ncbi:MAG TPA: GNAT family protein [Propionicimonas sp.]|uniref:GNAT family N-acetyltransferase n=1 Tax=Propionicimonas sp. TaxID=1955623 RepID=UPI002F42BEA8
MEGFTTDRLAVRRFRTTDGPALHAYLSRPEAVRFEPYPVQSAQDCERLAGERAGDPAFWAVCLADTGDLVGNLYLSRQQPDAWRTYELGYVFNPDHWGRRFATESAAALVSACFAGGAHRIVARCDPRNLASWRLLERLGFRREGHFIRSASFTTDAAGAPVWHDGYLYACLAEEWT